MIHNQITILLLIAHFLGDYHLQSEVLSQAKNEYKNALIKHLAIHGGLLLLVWLVSGHLELFPLFIIVWFSHILIDLIKTRMQKMWVNHAKYLLQIYIIDQLAHIGTILVTSLVLFPETNALSIWIPDTILKWLLLTVLITKPANITFKVLFSQYQNFSTTPQKDPTVPGAGAMIGNLERILSAVFLSLSALSSIGLIYTAKSIARFKLIEENQGFAEYYLIGTLFSILFVVIAYFLIF